MAHSIDDSRLLATLLDQPLVYDEGQFRVVRLIEVPQRARRPRRSARRALGPASIALLLSGALAASQGRAALASPASGGEASLAYRSPAVVLVARPAAGLAQAALQAPAGAAAARSAVPFIKRERAAHMQVAQLAAVDVGSITARPPAVIEQGEALDAVNFAPLEQPPYPPDAPPPPPPPPPAPLVVIYDGSQGAPPAAPPQAAPPSVTARPPARPSSAQVYTVQRKDTLRSIAKRIYGDERRWPTIYNANRSLISAPDKIYPGQRLSIPAASAAPPAVPPAAPTQPRPSLAGSYVVRQKDSLRAIAQEFYGDERRWPVIYNANRQIIGGDPDRLPIGIKLNIPGVSVAQPNPVAPAPQPIALPPAAPAPQPIPLPPAAPPASAITYLVAPGDSLWSIAFQLYGDHSKWVLLYEANRAIIGPNPDLLAPGTRLIVP